MGPSISRPLLAGVDLSDSVQPYRWLELRLSSCRLTQPLILVALQQQQQNGALRLAQPWL